MKRFLSIRVLRPGLLLGCLILLPLPEAAPGRELQFQQAPRRLPVVELRIAGHSLRAELALRPAEQERGLMFRTQLPPDYGMLFAWPQARKICMWMKNTLLPLSVAFIDANGRIISIQDMEPQTETRHCAPRPVPYALEMSQGWFAAADIRVYDRVEGLLERRPLSVGLP